MKRRTVKTFFAAFVLTLCVLGLLLSFLLIEWNMRQTVYGRVEPGVTFTLEQGAPTLTDAEGQPVTWLPQPWRQAAYALVAAPGRAALWLVRCEQAAAAWLFSYIGEYLP